MSTSHIPLLTSPRKSRGVTSASFYFLRQSQIPLESMEGEKASQRISGRGLEEQMGPRNTALAVFGKNIICHSHHVGWRNEVALGLRIPSALRMKAL